jgi:hypothetical protein
LFAHTTRYVANLVYISENNTKFYLEEMDFEEYIDRMGYVGGLV